MGGRQTPWAVLLQVFFLCGSCAGARPGHLEMRLGGTKTPSRRLTQASDSASVSTGCPADKVLFPLSNLNPSADPCYEFWEYSTGGWKANNSIPETDVSWSSFGIVEKQVESYLQSIIDESYRGRHSKGSNEQLIWDLYSSYVDKESRNKRGAQDLEPIFADIDAIESTDDLFTWMSEKKIYSGVFSILPDPIPSDSSKLGLWMSPSGLTMPQGYYLGNNSDTKGIQEKYLRHIESMASIIGQDWDAESIFELERSLAEIQPSPEKSPQAFQDAKDTSLGELQALAPSIPMIPCIELNGFNASSVWLVSPEYFANLSDLVSKTSIARWQELFKWHISHQFARSLSDDLADESFQFFSGTLEGATEQKTVEVLAAQAVSSLLPDAVGQMYVKLFFPPESKEFMDNLVENVRNSFTDRIRAVTWMSDTTKQKALEKVTAMTAHVGYPTIWEDYSGLAITGSYFQNRIALLKRDAEQQIESFSKPVDKNKWISPVQEVNAFYDPDKNSITFPAAILQPPFYDPCADDAMNYGAVGALIGHEITHGFDSTGSKYGPTGELENWWTQEDKTQFEALTSKLAQQYSSYEALPGLFVNGNLTLGENIADLGGLAVALQAYIKSTPREKVNAVGEDGFTGVQRLLMSFGRMWQSITRPERAKILLMNDPHSPDRFRVDGVMTNTPEFNTAFSCENKGLPNSDPIIIW